MNRATAIIGAVALAAALMIPRRAFAMTSVADQDTSDTVRPIEFNVDTVLPSVPDGTIPNWNSAADSSGNLPPYVAQDGGVTYTPWEDGWISQDGSYVPFEDGWIPQDGGSQMPAPNVAQQRIDSFLYAIKCCEHVYPRDVVNDACYGIFYGGISGFNTPDLMNQTFNDYSTHPVISGACRAVPLPPDTCRHAGISPGCVSTAAGAYQIIKSTFQRLSEKTGIMDFDDVSQDIFAEELLRECGAYDHIVAGRMDDALKAASKVWASLPGSLAQQGPKKVAFVIDRFNEGLAQYA